MRIPTSHQKSGNESAMTPMIDVVFLLLIFFVCTASFQISENILPSKLLTSGSSPTEIQIETDPPLENIIVRLTLQNGQPSWRVNDRACATLQEVRGVLSTLASIDAGLPVILDIAPPVPLGIAIDTYDTARLTGLENVQFSAEFP